VERWRERTEALLEKATQIIDEVDTLRHAMVTAAASSDVIVNQYAEDVDEALEEKLAKSITACTQIEGLLTESKHEIKRVTNETDMLLAAIESKASPLKYARCAFSDRKVYSRMPLDLAHGRLKRTGVRPMAFLLWCPLFLPVHTVICVQTLKATTRLQERRTRPSEEKTIDHVHGARF
jgi:hypothetical protein